MCVVVSFFLSVCFPSLVAMLPVKTIIRDDSLCLSGHGVQLRHVRLLLFHPVLLMKWRFSVGSGQQGAVWGLGGHVGPAFLFLRLWSAAAGLSTQPQTRCLTDTWLPDPAPKPQAPPTPAALGGGGGTRPKKQRSYCVWTTHLAVCVCVCMAVSIHMGVCVCVR